MDCVTPSQPVPIPHGESQDIEATLRGTSEGSLFADGRAMANEEHMADLPSFADATSGIPKGIHYRDSSISFLRAQNAETRAQISQAASPGQLEWESFQIAAEDSPAPYPNCGSQGKRKTTVLPKPSAGIKPRASTQELERENGDDSRSTEARRFPMRDTKAREKSATGMPLSRAPITSPWPRRAPTSLF